MVSTTVVTGVVKIEVTALEMLEVEEDEVVLGMVELLCVSDVGGRVGEVGARDEDKIVDMIVEDEDD